MQENKKSIKLQKVGTIALLCLLVVAFVGSIFCAMILPFANLSSEVASAYDWTGPLLADLEVGDSVYGFKVTSYSDLASYFVSKNISPSVAQIDFNALGIQGEVTSFLTLEFASSNVWSLFFDYDDFGSSSGVWSGNNVIASSSPSGLGYLYFDSPCVLQVSYSNSTPVESALWDCPYLQCLTTPLNQGWNPEAFATRFVTPTDSPSNTVFFNLDTTPRSPKLADFTSYSSGALSWYYYDYFQEVGTDGSLISANDVQTVGWHVSFNSQTSVYRVELRIGRQVIYYYDVNGSSFDTGTISGAQWNVASNYTFGDMKLYKYDFSGASSYYTLLPHEEGKVRPVDSQFGEGGWNSWLSLFDLSNFVSLSNDVYINLGYQNAKLYYDELIKTKTQESFLQGKNQGYELGFQEGKLQGGNYTFTSLIGAVFDAPIEAFRGLFNFEILGTNMQGFVLALLTLSVIIVVIKFALGGK